MCVGCRVRCGRCHRDSSVDNLATYSKSSCPLRSLYASRPSPSLPASTTSCLHHHHFHQHPQQQVPAAAAAVGHLCSASPGHHDHCAYSRRRLCSHGDASSACRCIYDDDDDDEDDDGSSDTAAAARRRHRLPGRVKPLLAPDTDTQTDGETDLVDKPPPRSPPPDCPLATTHRLLVTSSDQLPVTSDVISACRAAELVVA